MLGRAAHFGKCVEQFLGFACDRSGLDAQAGQNRRNRPLRLLDQRQHQVQRLELLVAVAAGKLLGRLHRFLRLYREFVESRRHSKILNFPMIYPHRKSPNAAPRRRGLRTDNAPLRSPGQSPREAARGCQEKSRAGVQFAAARLELTTSVSRVSSWSPGS